MYKRQIPVFVGNVENLEKRSTRVFRRTLFGSMVNLWLFDRRCVKPDKANAGALALLPRDSSHRTDRLWTLVQDTCPLPVSYTHLDVYKRQAPWSFLVLKHAGRTADNLCSLFHNRLRTAGPFRVRC